MSNMDYRGAEQEMLNLIMDEIRYIRQKLDAHIADEDKSVERVRKDISQIREELAQYKTKIGIISSGVALFVGGIISWIVSHMGIK